VIQEIENMSSKIIRLMSNRIYSKILKRVVPNVK
jgi:hypothetical protein